VTVIGGRGVIMPGGLSGALGGVVHPVLMKPECCITMPSQVKERNYYKSIFVAGHMR
jgi:hypothetical protein